MIEGNLLFGELYTGEFEGGRQLPFLQRVTGSVFFGQSQVTSIQWHGETKLDIGRNMNLFPQALEVMNWTRPTDMATRSRVDTEAFNIPLESSRTGIACPLMLFLASILI